MDTPPKDVQDGELSADLEPTQEEAEDVKGGLRIYKYRKEHKDRHHRS